MNSFSKENELKELFYKKFKIKNLAMQKLPLIKYKVETAIDFQIEFDGKTYLFEVDTYNTAKVLFGQYLLLNNFIIDPEKYIYVPVHYNSKFNIIHSFNHLDYASKKLGCKIPFIIFDQDSIKRIIKKSKTIADFFELLHAHNTLETVKQNAETKIKHRLRKRKISIKTFKDYLPNSLTKE
ncbi:MAG: hypothetical protein Q8M15_08270 [Bacteroidota bacterium]|nr:hypothetical protein [Bacteroidota bacterium]